MKRWISVVSLLVLGFVVGCPETPTDSGIDTTGVPKFGPEGMSSAGMARPSDNERVNPVVTVKFVGAHKGEKPDPRHVFLTMAEGQMYMPGGELKALKTLRVGMYTVSLDVDAAASGLDTEGATKLRDHLRGPDFFNTKQFPTAEFDATSITLNEDGTGTIVGTLKMMGQTGEITAPVTYDNDAKVLEAKFQLDRTKFGMTYGLERIEEMVDVMITLDVSKG